MPTRRQVLITAAAGVAAASALGVGTCYYTFYIEPHWVEEVRRPMPVRNLPSASWRAGPWCS